MLTGLLLLAFGILSFEVEREFLGVVNLILGSLIIVFNLSDKLQSRSKERD